MRFEVAFVAGYALVLTLGAWGLHRLGQVNSSAWSSRMLAAYRAQTAEPPEPGRGWPHDDASRLHSGIGAVAAGAALALIVVGVIRHRGPIEVAVLSGVGLLAFAVLARLLAAARS